MSVSPPHSRPATIEAEVHGELACWTVRTPYGTARVARQGAQLLSYDDHEGRPLIWLSESAQYLAGEPLRGGVPVCWPWFGVYARNPEAVRDTVQAAPDAASHGLVRGLDWTLASQHVDAHSAELVFELDASRDLQPWRHPARLRYVMRFGAKLTLALSVQNLGEQTITQSLALHSYFAVGDSRQVTIDGLSGKSYIDTVGGQWTTRMQEGSIRIVGETDRIYLQANDPVVIHDPVWRRSIHIAAQHSQSCVVWNPWVEKSRGLSQFADDDWQRMVCVETARVLEDTLVVEPGATQGISLSIHTESEQGL